MQASIKAIRKEYATTSVIEFRALEAFYEL